MITGRRWHLLMHMYSSYYCYIYHMHLYYHFCVMRLSSFCFNSSTNPQCHASNITGTSVKLGIMFRSAKTFFETIIAFDCDFENIIFEYVATWSQSLSVIVNSVPELADHRQGFCTLHMLAIQLFITGINNQKWVSWRALCSFGSPNCSVLVITADLCYLI